jgi:cell division transport system permease protein
MNSRAFSEGFKNVVRNIWLSTTAITILVVSISLVAITGMVRTTANTAINYYNKQITIPAYLKDSLTEPQIQTLKSQLEEIPAIGSVEFVTKEQDKARLIASDPTYKDTLDDLKGNPLQNSFRILPRTPEQYQAVADTLTSKKWKDNFTAVKLKEDIVSRLNRIRLAADTAGLVIIALFSIVSVMIMINILRISIHNFRDEIEIMRLVGATNSYIQRPFVIQGFYYSVIACLLVAAVFVPFIYYVGLPTIFKYLSITDEVRRDTISWELFGGLGIVMGVTVLISIVASYFATKRYLKL